MKKTTSSSPVSRAKIRQRLARTKVLDYIERLGKRKAARRLLTTVSILETWIRGKRFPPEIIESAIGLGAPGGAYTNVRGTRLAIIKKKFGLKKLSRLIGLTPKEIRRHLKRFPKGSVRVHRETLEEQVRKQGLAKLAKILGATKRRVDNARKRPITEPTRRLRRLVNTYKLPQISSFLGVSEATLKSWLRKNVPPKWEAAVTRAAGTRPDKETSQANILVTKGRTEEQILKEIKLAEKKIDTWNRKHKTSPQITKATAEIWIRTGVFEKMFEAAKQAILDAKSPPKPPKIPQPPVKAPAPPSPTLYPKPPPKLPKAPPRTGKSIDENVQQAMDDFRRARAQALATNPDATKYLPQSPFGKTEIWRGIHRAGIRHYGKVEEFVRLVNITALGNKIIKTARDMMRMMRKPGSYMTITLMFSAQGAGNPFYPEAFEPDKNRFGFFKRMTGVITDVREIDHAIRSILNEAWEVSEKILMFFEHYEIVKSEMIV